ncbi:hypothetical protein [Streptomyces sp. NPDC048659]|uniref:hypothetical protein n=1 Tax=Streptomyces sp. NPDC048659 TaxID=3155489 RepID=UPI00342E2B5C
MSEHPVPDETSSPARAGGWGRRLLTTVLPAVLVLGAAGGGVAYTAVTVAHADRTAPTVAWQDPAGKPGKDPVGTLGKGRADTPMSKFLLPVPPGYRLGPDVESYGKDGELGAREAGALLKAEARGLAGKKRRDFEKRIDRLGVQGIGVRSYSSDSDDLVAQITIVRLKDRRKVRELHELKTGLAALLERPKGPKVPGHKNAVCYGVSDYDERDDRKKAETDLSGMTCSAYDSDLMVSVRAYGAAPFEESAVADLVKRQLDHIKSPGEYV